MNKLQTTHYKLQTNKGFTLLEVLLSIALIAIILGITTPVYVAFSRRNDLDLATDTATQALRRAQILSQGMSSDDNWGVEIQFGNIIIFKGNVFSTRDQNFDENFSISSAITFSGSNEVIFNKFLGDTSGGTINLINTTENATRTININSKGLVTY